MSYGVAEAAEAYLAETSFVVAVRNTFITILDGEASSEYQPRRNSWPMTRWMDSSSCPASGCKRSALCVASSNFCPVDCWRLPCAVSGCKDSTHELEVSQRSTCEHGSSESEADPFSEVDSSESAAPSSRPSVADPPPELAISLRVASPQVERRSAAKRDSGMSRPPAGAAFQESVVALAEAAAAALQELDCYSHSEVRFDWGADEGDGGVCSLLVTPRLGHCEALEVISAKTQEAILARTSRSAGVCLIGYKTEPFVLTPQGFVAKLGEVCARRQVCRQFYAEGCCKYMDSCYRQHPTYVALPQCSP